MTLTPDDLQAIARLIDERLEVKLEEKFTQKLKPIYEFIEFAQPILEALLEESQDRFEEKLPQRVQKLEAIHPGGHHPS